MKKIIFLFAICFVVIQACNFSSDNKPPDAKLADNIDYKLIDKKRCTFSLADDLSLQNIDTTVFSKEGYFKIKPSVDPGMLQIFVFEGQSDINDKIDRQEKALNQPEVFTASQITPVNHWGKYEGKGIVMNGVYKGGLIKGKITVFAYSNDKSSFLIVRQDIGSHELVKANFDQIENSFKLK
jgi:hypothetical protein